MCLKLSMSMNASANCGCASAVGEKVLDLLLDQRAVRQSGEIVEIGALRQFGFRLLARGEIDGGGKHELAVEDARRLRRSQQRALAGALADAILRDGRCILARRGGIAIKVCGRIIGEQRAPVVRLHPDADRKLVDDVDEDAQRPPGLGLAALRRFEQGFKPRRLGLAFSRRCWRRLIGIARCWIGRTIRRLTIFHAPRSELIRRWQSTTAIATVRDWRAVLQSSGSDTTGAQRKKS